MEELAVIAVIIGLVLVFMVTGIAEDKKAKRRFRQKLQARYGCFSDKKYADGRMESIASVLSDAGDAFVVDAITWNDLDMDRLFAAIDFTGSAAGEEALYRWLRLPVFEEETLAKRERHICFFSAHEKERLDYLVHMSKVGRTGKYSVYDYLDYLDRIPEKIGFFTGVLDVALVVSLVLGLVVHGGFFLVLIALMLYQSFRYMSRKREIEPYLMTFSYFVRVLDAAGRLDRLSAAFREEFAAELAEIREERAVFGTFKRLSGFVLANACAGTGPTELFGIVMTYVNMLFHLDLMFFYSMLHIIRENKKSFIRLMRKTGEIEACVSVAYARAAFGTYAVPKLLFEKRDGEIVYESENMYHPLIADPVKNSVHAGRGMLLTGSNASGKSTFLKMAALNALLAQTIHTVCADSYRADCFCVYSSMALRDSLQEGDSYFIVEIKSLKRIFDAADAAGGGGSQGAADAAGGGGSQGAVDAAGGGSREEADGGLQGGKQAPVLCVIDEVLRGTNTAERIGASTALLRALSKKRALCFAATHDLELTTLLADCLDNYHFAEQAEGKDIRFSYRLEPGFATGRNAIRLLAAYGFDEAVVLAAKETAGGFM